MVTIGDIRAAAARLQGVLMATPCRRSEFLSRRFGTDIFLKLENLHVTGSFKERGALNRLSLLTPAERERGVITASAGNHAMAVAYHASRLGVAATVIMPVRAPLTKVLTCRELGGRVIQHGASFDDAYAEAVRLSAERDQVFVSPFDDDAVIAGQGTVGLELLEQVPDLATVVVPVGGGGLIGGIGAALKAARPEVRVVGVEAAGFCSLKSSLAAGEVVGQSGAPTLADGIAVKRCSARTLALARRCVDEVVEVDEESIASAILNLLERHKTLAEGAAAATLAALASGTARPDGKTVLVISGGNIDSTRLDDIIRRGLAADGRRVRLQAVMPDVPGQLHRLTGVIADLGANVLEVLHDRSFGDAAMGQTETTLTLETRGEEHVAELMQALSDAGFEHVQRIPAAAHVAGALPVAAY